MTRLDLRQRWARSETPDGLSAAEEPGDRTHRATHRSRGARKARKRNEMTQMDVQQPGRAGGTEPVPVIEMHDISIAFGGVQALDRVSLRLLPGEVHALMGENGAGKSTLIKALTGVYGIDGGTVLVGGEEHAFSSPAASQAAGISTVYQEVNLLPNLTVAENMLLGREPRRFGSINTARHEPPGPRDARGPRPRHRPHVRARRAPDRDPAARRHRPRGRCRGPGADPRRTHLQPRRRRGGQALRGDAPAARAGRRDRLRLALPRPGLRDRRPDDHPAQRRAGRASGWSPRPPSSSWSS